MVKIMVISNSHRTVRRICESQFNKIEVDEVYHQEDENDDTCMDHILTEERSV